MRRRMLVATLPPTPCTPEMRNKIVEISDKQGVSISEVVRKAISLFLSENVQNNDNFVDERDETITDVSHRQPDPAA